MTAATIGETAEWTNKVEIADLDGDGSPELLFANGGDYESPGTPEPARVFRAAADGSYEEITDAVFGDERFLSRAIKVADLDGDGAQDILVSGTYQTASRLFRGLGDGRFEPAEGVLPETPHSIGDLEIGDVDADGRLDVVVADWGQGSPMTNQGGLVRLWLNDGDIFRDTPSAMPDVLVGFSWDLELVDVDNDWDLDIVVSCKQCEGGRLFENDGTGLFTDVTEGRLPPAPNNYEFEPMDLDGDLDLDLVTINDGPEFRERVLANDGTGTFSDVTADWWPDDANLGFDDNMVAFLDVESDGDADFVIGSLDGPDRLLINDGTGRLRVETGIIDTDTASGGTLGIALADLDGDGRLDLVEGQGEVPGHENERIYLGAGLPPDTAPPVVDVDETWAGPADLNVHARVHDRTSPSRALAWQRVEVRVQGDPANAFPLRWYGEYLWRGALPDGTTAWSVCATDAAGNERCSDLVEAG